MLSSPFPASSNPPLRPSSQRISTSTFRVPMLNVRNHQHATLKLNPLLSRAPANHPLKLEVDEIPRRDPIKDKHQHDEDTPDSRLCRQVPYRLPQLGQEGVFGQHCQHQGC